jgi:hypothetical protein
MCKLALHDWKLKQEEQQEKEDSAGSKRLLHIGMELYIVLVY